MQVTRHKGTSKKGLSLLIIPVLLCLAWSGEARAQYRNKVLAIGELNHVYSEIGGGTECYANCRGLRWPAIWRTGTLRAEAVWVAAENVKGADGVTYPYRVMHVGPRATGAGEYIPIEFKTVSKFEPPMVLLQDEFGDEYETYADRVGNDAVDPNLPADRMVMSKVSSLLGITITRRNYAFSDPIHDNYHIQEFVLTNTGDVDGDLSTQELDQTLNGVYLHFHKRYNITDKIEGPGGGWGANVMNDVVGDGVHDYGVDFKAQYAWLGNFNNSDGFDDYGLSKWRTASWSQEADTIGRLSATPFLGVATLYADEAVGGVPQPSMTGTIDADDPLLSANSATNIPKMTAEYQMIIGANMENPHGPHHADGIDQDDNFLTPDGDPMNGRPGGWAIKESYGPYSLAVGDSVKIVVVEATDGLDMNEATIIGRQFKRLAGTKSAGNTALATTDNITYRGLTMSKNAWYFTGRDSLFDTFQRAIDVYGATNGLTNYPDAAGVELVKPPARFKVESGVGRIALNWELYPGESPDHVEIYRTENYLEGRLRVDNDADFTNDPYFDYACIASSATVLSGRCAADGAAQITTPGQFEDTDVSRGINYYYYIQTVTADGKRSNRYWTQTYDPAISMRGPGETISSFKVVPNPFNVAAQEGVRYPGPRKERIAFLDIPGNSTIRIYTEKGELIRTIEHTTGSGDEYWDVTTDSQQLVVSGLYIAVVDDNDTGEREMKKFVVIR